jgi:hypothetical protein
LQVRALPRSPAGHSLERGEAGRRPGEQIPSLSVPLLLLVSSFPNSLGGEFGCRRGSNKSPARRAPSGAGREEQTRRPSRQPLYWCEAVERKRLDCGAHAAIAQELFTARSVKSFPAQFVQYSDEATRHWGQKWGEEDIATAWINGDLIYHEGCAVAVGDEEIKLWDPSAGLVDQPPAVRRLRESAQRARLRAGGRELPLGRPAHHGQYVGVGRQAR